MVRFKMKFSSALLSATALSAVIEPIAGSPDPSQVSIAGITYGGTGCPQGTVSAAFSEDAKTVTMIFDQFLAQTGDGLSPSEARKACQINVDLRYPQGWSYSIFKVDYRGYVGIPAGFTALQKATYYFSGDSAQLVSTTKYIGPKYTDYTNTDVIPTEKFVWSRCGAVERGNIKTSVELRGDYTQPALMTVDSIDGTVKQIYGVQWRRC